MSLPPLQNDSSVLVLCLTKTHPATSAWRAHRRGSFWKIRTANPNRTCVRACVCVLVPRRGTHARTPIDRDVAE